jgi:3-hydroxyacyl-[acyl-carrier-protein] dehydratase
VLFHLLDRIETDAADGRAVGAFTLPADAPYLADHFPGFPVMPGALVLEAMVGAARVITGDAAALLRRLEAVRFAGMVRPGETLEVVVEAEGMEDSFRWFRATAVVAGRRVASARFAL